MRRVLSSMTPRPKAPNPEAPSLSRHSASGQRQRFSNWHLQRFAQRREICVARAHPATFPIVDRYLRDTQSVSKFRDREALDLPRLTDLFT